MADDDLYGERGSSGKESVLVFARFRPQDTKEEHSGGEIKAKFTSNESCSCINDDGNPIAFTFDRIFQPGCSQKLVFDTTTKPVLEDMLSGYYATVFAYGQTGSGKTFTMEGVKKSKDPELVGIIPRAAEYIFERVSALSGSTDTTVAASYVEIYMEKIRDLLDRTKQKNNLDVRVDLQRGVYVDGTTEVVVNTKEELLLLMDRGSDRRHVSATGMNEESSRSHAIFMITCSQKSRSDGTVKTGKIFLVDLAGSEMVSKTGAGDKRLEEAKHINKSLSALGNVIKALTDKDAKFVPYRDSKLTRILQDSLGGGARTALIVACSPSSYNMSETISTLRFGTRAKFIKNKLRLHVGYGDGSGGVMSEVLAKREEEIGRMQAHFATLEAELRALRHEKVVYQKVYGEIAHIEQAQVDRLPAVNMTEKLKLYEDISFKLTAECKAVALEAASLRPFVRAPRPTHSLVTDSLNHLLTHSGGSHTHPTCDRGRKRTRGMNSKSPVSLSPISLPGGKVKSLTCEARERRGWGLGMAITVQITEFEKHLRDERSLFGQLRSDMARLFKRLTGGGGGDARTEKEVSEQYVEADKMLGMGKWKAEQMLQKLRPLQRATMQVAAAAAATSMVQQQMLEELGHGGRR